VEIRLKISTAHGISPFKGVPKIQNLFWELQLFMGVLDIGVEKLMEGDRHVVGGERLLSILVIGKYVTESYLCLCVCVCVGGR